MKLKKQIAEVVMGYTWLLIGVIFGNVLGGHIFFVYLLGTFFGVGMCSFRNIYIDGFHKEIP